MTEKNSTDNQNSKKKYKWFAIFLIAILLLLIGIAGYYLERDLMKLPEEQLEEEQQITQNGDQELSELQQGGSNNQIDENGQKISDLESSTKKEENDALIESGKDKAIKGESADNLEDKTIAKTDTSKDDTAINGDTGSKDDTAIENDTGSKGDIISKDSVESKNDQKTEENIKETESKELGEFKTEPDDFGEEISEPSILDRILSILGLAESDFSQNLNILFVGLDDEESVTIGRVEADSIMLGKMRPEKNKLKIKNINKNTVYKGQLLSEYYDGKLKNAVEDLSSVKIDYYVYVNYQGFERVIDELGGVQINLTEKIEVPALGLNLKAGNNLLSGKEALNFVRWQNNDYLNRFERQKMLIDSVLNKLKGNNILFNVKDLYNTIVESYNSVKTDISPVLAAEIFTYIKENEDFSLEFID